MRCRVWELVDELRGQRPCNHLAPQQEDKLGVVLAFVGIPCEFGENCAYPGLG